MPVPSDLHYTSTHEWIRPGGGPLRVGITDFAQDALGDIVLVTLPEPGTTVRVGEPLGELDSTKATEEIYAPLSGTVTARNDALADHPELLNEDPYGEGWLVEIDSDGSVDLGGLLDAAGYSELVEGH